VEDGGECVGCGEEGEFGDEEGGEAEEVPKVLCCYGGDGDGWGGDEFVDGEYAADVFLWELLGGLGGVRFFVRGDGYLGRFQGILIL